MEPQGLSELEETISHLCSIHLGFRSERVLSGTFLDNFLDHPNIVVIFLGVLLIAFHFVFIKLSIFVHD